MTPKAHERKLYIGISGNIGKAGATSPPKSARAPAQPASAKPTSPPRPGKPK